MRARRLVVLLMAGAMVAGCASSELRARKDDAWSDVPQTLPDGYRIHNPALPTLSRLPDPDWTGYEPVPNGYGHVLRGIGFLLHPVGVALDYALVRPFYMLGGLAPEWFGLRSEDARRYQGHMPELVISRDEPRRFD
jgi:hypothetical protein